MSGTATRGGKGKQKECKMSLHNYAVQVQVPLKLPLRLKWRRGPDMPFGMCSYVQSVQGTLYVGGGIVIVTMSTQS